jgi:hypothetical protein
MANPDGTRSPLQRIHGLGIYSYKLGTNNPIRELSTDAANFAAQMERFS